MTPRRVAITGLGVVSPVGIGKEAFWDNLLRGRSGAKALDEVGSSSLFGHHDFLSRVVCEVEDFDPEALGLPEECREMDRWLQFAVAGAKLAYEDARLEVADPSRAGVSLSTAVCGTRGLEQDYVAATDFCQGPFEPDQVSPQLYRAYWSNSAATLIAQQYGFEGECLTLSTGCIGGLDAVAYAHESIASGDHDVMLAGGVDAPISPITIAAFDVIHCLTHCDDAPTASRPFSASRDGFVLSEGCGVVVMEELEHARARGVHIYAESLGWSVTSNATHMTDLANGGMDLARAIAGALQSASLDPEEVELVNAHGTSTPQNDRNETLAIKAVLGDHARRVAVNSTKSMVGHSMGGAGGVEIVACALSISNRVIHQTINQIDPDPDCDLDYVADGPRTWAANALLTTGSGFGGLHAALAMGRYDGG